MLTCKECGREIKGKGKTGLCLSCAHKSKNWNKTGRCKDCWHTGRKGGNTNVPGQQARVKAICCNSNCRKEFYARPDQHPRYSLCPTCAAARDRMSNLDE